MKSYKQMVTKCCPGLVFSLQWSLTRLKLLFANSKAVVSNVPQFDIFIKWCRQTWNLSKNLHDPIFGRKNFTHTGNAKFETIFASNKQQKCIIINILVLFCLKLNIICKFFDNYEESLHLGVCKLEKYVRSCVVFWKKFTLLTKILHGGRDKFHVWVPSFSHSASECSCGAVRMMRKT